ncbi:MAG: lipid-A-disaccharide synthase [Thermodesulfobacteriota bacterium]|nr:lipid-A-disaccharide synthase [Thermodesulfobacteriota bacterium]
MVSQDPIGDVVDNPSKRILIVAGEASADLHGSNLIHSIKEINPNVEFYGIGGEKIRAMGVDILYDASSMAVVGITEVFSKLKTIMKALRDLKKSLDSYCPDLVILIDYPDFNLHLAKFARKKGIPVLYYISPQIWAWRGGRIKKIARLVDKMLLILPFERSFYEKEKIDVEFVGHPLVDIVNPKFSKDEALKRFNLEKDRLTIGLLPGSRKSEVKRLLPIMLNAMKLLNQRLKTPQLVLPVASTMSETEIRKIIDKTYKDANVNIIEGHTYDLINISNVVIVASGTATLEAAIMNSPMVILYKVSSLTYFIGKFLVKVKDIGLVNLVAGRRIVSELIQNDVTPERIANEVMSILENEEVYYKMKNELSWVKRELGTPGASFRVAKIATDMLSS